MNDFNKVLIQNKEIEGIKSEKFKYGEYDWSIQAVAEKDQNLADEDLWFVVFLFCEADDKTDFPLFANIKYSILNKDKDSRKDLFKCN